MGTRQLPCSPPAKQWCCRLGFSACCPDSGRGGISPHGVERRRRRYGPPPTSQCARRQRRDRQGHCQSPSSGCCLDVFGPTYRRPRRRNAAPLRRRCHEDVQGCPCGGEWRLYDTNNITLRPPLCPNAPTRPSHTITPRHVSITYYGGGKLQTHQIRHRAP